MCAEAETDFDSAGKRLKRDAAGRAIVDSRLLDLLPVLLRTAMDRISQPPLPCAMMLRGEKKRLAAANEILWKSATSHSPGRPTAINGHPYHLRRPRCLRISSHRVCMHAVR